MPYKKYRELAQWGRIDTQIFKRHWKAVNAERQKKFEIPDAVKAYGPVIHNPNDPSFFKQFEDPINSPLLSHPALRPPPVEEHPLYNPKECHVYESFEPFSDGIDQACHLMKAIKFDNFPADVLNAEYNILRNTAEHDVRDCIMQGERYDPTLEPLEIQLDKILFWVKHPRLHGTPTLKRNNIILESLFRKVLLSAVKEGKLENIRYDRNTYFSAILNNRGFEDSPLVIRGNPHLIVQSDFPLKPWANEDAIQASRDQPVVDVYPINPLIDFSSSNLYNRTALIPRAIIPNLHINTLFVARQQNQKYPWTTEQNAANAIILCFGGALAEATRNLSEEAIAKLGDLEKPVMAKTVQLVDGKLDLVAVQLNTLDLSSRNGIKNFVWCKKAVPLYKPIPFWENMVEVEGLNIKGFNNFVSLLLKK
uniref:39S ribosomal protein L37, mitochondrial n=1 Tax=Panagrolaimus superbus TaxID=310955 RepID=A0A914YY65_9BILA